MEKINLIIFARRPEISVGKTRLKKRIGRILGANFYYYNLIQTIKRLNSDKRINITICATPDSSIRSWPKNVFSTIPRIAQGSGDIGTKMWKVLSDSSSKKIIIGSDIPNITSKIIITAWKKLYSSQIVFGPSEDGGFWLIGLSQNHKIKKLFNNVNWSRNDTLDQVVNNINSSVNVSYVDTLIDID